jgi:hypothetical protein
MSDLAELSPVPIKEISVEIHGIGGYRNVHTVADLASILISDRWPKKAGNTAFRHALAQCLSALENQGGRNRARKAFVEAARDVGITVLPDDMSSPQNVSPRRRDEPRAAVTKRLPGRALVGHSR